MMRYIDITEYGGPQVMEIKEGEVPAPKKGEVLIKVHAAGVNRPDVMQRQGLYPPPPRSAEAKASIAENLRTQIWPLIESGEIKPVIAARFPLTDAAESHKLMESSKHIGKIILTVAK